MFINEAIFVRESIPLVSKPAVQPQENNFSESDLYLTGGCPQSFVIQSEAEDHER